VVPLKGSKYATWKVQAKMLLMKEGFWRIVDGMELVPTTPAAAVAPYNSRKDKALAILVLSVEPSLLCLIGDTEDPNTVWMKLSNQFCKKSWVNKLKLRQKLHSMNLKPGNSVQEHIRFMTELFIALTEMESPLSEEDRVVYLLASLPE